MTKRKIVLFAVLAAAAAILIGFFCWLYGTPGQYFLAERACERAARFTQSTLENVPDGYKDAAKLKRYAAALVLAEEENYTEAVALLKGLGDYRNAVTHWEEITYDYAVSLREQGDYDEAIAQFEACFCGDWKTQVTLTTYEKAILLQQNGEWFTAAERFGSLGDYADSASRRRACLAQYARTLAESGDAAEAAALLDSVRAEGNEASAAADAVYYACALALMEEEKWEEALARLDLCTPSEEVTESRTYCTSMLTYLAAVGKMDEGDYVAAIELFDTIAGFSDADELNASCEVIAYKWAFTGYLSKDGTESTKTKTFKRADKITVYGTLSGGKPGKHISLRFVWVDAYGCTAEATVEDWENGTSGGVEFAYSVPKNANIGKSKIYVYNNETGVQIAKFSFTVKK